ncbi:MAG TPA: YncE family protein, partial [Polyangiaceae bacterium]|nr:YncE family protein [Polyangiaceae bacterium]
MTRRHENKSRANQGNGFASAILVGLGFFAGGCSDDKPSAPVEFPIEDAGGRSEAEAAVSVEAGVASRFSRASRGAAIDISEDDSLLVAVNRDVNTVSVFDVAYAAGGAPTLTKKAEVAVCAEPHQIALSPAGDRAYVVCRKDQKLLRLDNLRSAPVKGLEVAVGSEPTGLALTPKGKAVWIANWIDGTVLEIDAEAMTVTTTVDLNAALAATGMLGAGIAARPALAHPRSVVITTNKDDVESDESVFVTEFFAQQKEPLAADGANADIAKQGVVYRIGLRDKKVQTITLPPIADIGFHDHNDQQAGCYPNQLQAIDVQGSFAYVVSICASPKGPLGAFTGPNKAACTADATCPGAAAGSCDLVAGACKTNCTTNAECGLAGVCDANICKDNFTDVRSVQTPAVSVIDTGANRVVASVSLNAEFDKLYASLATPDTSERRLPLNATDMAFIPGTLTAYFAAHGADAVFRVAFNATYETKAVDAVGSQGVPFISLNRGTFDASKVGKLPIGIVMTHKSRSGDAAAQFAFVANDATRNVTVIDTKTGDIAGLPEQPTVAALTAMPTEPAKIAELEGKHLFSTGLGRWSLSGQGWAACSSCHWDALSDQVTWFHLRGPRQSPSLDGTVNSKNPQQIRAMNWSAIVDELEDHEGGALRTIAGGVGAIVKNFDLVNTARVALDRTGHAGLNGSAHVAANPMSSSALVTDVCVLDDWAKLSIFQSNL